MAEEGWNTQMHGKRELAAEFAAAREDLQKMVVQVQKLEAKQEAVISARKTCGLVNWARCGWKKAPALQQLAEEVIAEEEPGKILRNIFYGTKVTRGLPVYYEPHSFPLDDNKLNGHLAFGDRVELIKERKTENGMRWFHVKSLATQLEGWVVGEIPNRLVNCVDMQKYWQEEGRIPKSAYLGQDFPHHGMFTKGYDGKHEVCLVSAAGDNFWREIHIELLMRDIGTATVFEEAWGGIATFTDWVSSYATNCFLYGKIGTSKPKRLIVTVKPTADYTAYPKVNVTPSAVKEDIGKTQMKECEWLKSNLQKHGLWNTVEFMTAFQFLTQFCKWKQDDCKRAASEKAERVLTKETFKALGCLQMERQFEMVEGSLKEAFDGEALPNRISDIMRKTRTCIQWVKSQVVRLKDVAEEQWRGKTSAVTLLTDEEEQQIYLAALPFKQEDTPGPLLGFLKDPRSWKVWQAGSKVIGSLQDPCVRENLVYSLQDSRSPKEVQAAAAIALGNLRDPLALPALQATLQDPDPDVRDAAVGAFSGPGNKADKLLRNIHYGKRGSNSLPVYTHIVNTNNDGVVVGNNPKDKPKGFLTFGDSLKLLEECQPTESSPTWFRVKSLATHLEGWVVGKVPNKIINCVDMGEYGLHKGPIPVAAFRGQDFPHGGMYTEGYSGQHDVCLISASGDNFWREVNIELLFRNIGTATVYEQDWDGNAEFTDWVAFYACNCAMYGRLGTETPKRFIVTVKPTADYTAYPKAGILPSAVKDDIGKAQLKECEWLCSNLPKKGYLWEDVLFTTTFQFLKSYCRWSQDDCKTAAKDKAIRVLDKKAFRYLDLQQMEHQLETVKGSLREAFDQGSFPHDVPRGSFPDDVRNILKVSEALKGNANSLLEKLREAARKGNEAVKEAAMMFVQQGLVGPLKSGLKDKNPRVRRAAADALGHLCDRAALPELEKALKDELHAGVLWAVEEAVEKLKLDAPPRFCSF